eukprot:TRINITY_DN5073_c0_g2_i1.p1 TRINITY_DN5073_c0_g2~~TRINITY_DN5073_c0_g2_i1.p1  ORF type:complete len:306 (-),score=52.03 TRINITY_DN5073_c0_g2_i1:237-1154(-)
MAQAGLHAIAHMPAADGSGRDCLIFQDGGWRQGKMNGQPMQSRFHPIFQRGEKLPLFTTEKPETLDKSQSAHSLGFPSDQERVYRMQAGGSVTYLSKDAIAAMSPHRGTGLSASLSFAGKINTNQGTMRRTSSGVMVPRGFRSRDTMTNFEAWATKVPKHIDTTGKARPERETKFIVSHHYHPKPLLASSSHLAEHQAVLDAKAAAAAAKAAAALPYQREKLEERKKLFSLCDPNGNGYASFAELDNVISRRCNFKQDQKMIMLKCFNEMRNYGMDGGLSDSYIEAKEFRMFLEMLAKSLSESIA